MYLVSLRQVLEAASKKRFGSFYGSALALSENKEAVKQGLFDPLNVIENTMDYFTGSPIYAERGEVEHIRSEVVEGFEVLKKKDLDFFYFSSPFWVFTRLFVGGAWVLSGYSSKQEMLKAYKETIKKDRLLGSDSLSFKVRGGYSFEFPIHLWVVNGYEKYKRYRGYMVFEEWLREKVDRELYKRWRKYHEFEPKWEELMGLSHAISSYCIVNDGKVQVENWYILLDRVFDLDFDGLIDKNNLKPL